MSLLEEELESLLYEEDDVEEWLVEEDSNWFLDFFFHILVEKLDEFANFFLY